MYKISLVNAPCSVHSPRTSFVPLPLLVLGSSLREIKEKGYNIDFDLIDLDLIFKQGHLNDSPDFHEVAAGFLLKQSDADSFFITAHGTNIGTILKIVQALKKRKPLCFIALGGTAVTLSARDIIENFPYVDLAINGEAEPVLPLLIPALLSNGDLSQVPSSVYRKNGVLKENPKVYIKDGYAIPSPDYSLVNLEEYLEHNKKNPYIVPGFALVEPGRGCAHNCVFCAPAKVWGRHVKYRPLDKIIDEMRFLAQQGFNFTFFTQDNLDLKFLKKLCQKLIEEKVGIPWGCYSRLKDLPDELAPQLAQAGCRLIFVGFETPNQETQKFIRKTIDREKSIAKAARYNSLGIQLIGSFIGGFPGESEEALNNTLTFALECSVAKPFDELKKFVHEKDSKEFPLVPANFSMVHPLGFMPGTDFDKGIHQEIRISKYSVHDDTIGTHIFALDDFMRKYYHVILNPYVTFLKEEKVVYYYSILRLFNFLVFRPYFFTLILEFQQSNIIKFLVLIVEKLGREFVLTACKTEFNTKASALLNSYLKKPITWSDDRVVEDSK